MKLTEITPRKGKRRVVVELDTGEDVLVFRYDAHYRLGCQVDDIVSSDVLFEAVEHRWCSIAQEWVSCR